MKTVIFDLDGTLADTSGDLIAAANACFRDMGHAELLDETADALVGFHGGRAMLKLGYTRLGVPFDETDIDREYPKLIQHYTENIHVKTVLYPGVLETIDVLRADGYRLGICTNKPHQQTEVLLDSLGVTELFDAMIAADTLAERKPHPLPYRTCVERAGGAVEHSILIGDTITDVNTARAVGVPIVLVAFGPEGDAISRLEPDAMLASYSDLPALAGELIG